MSESSNEHLPISEEATRDFSCDGADSDSLHFCTSSDDQARDVPSQLGDYLIRELIGSGGMGNVFLAEHIRMQRIVAIKMLPIERMKDESAVKRFYGEVRAASRLMHPNIVTAFDAGESDGIHYLAMEYVDGMTLTGVVAHDGPFSVGEAAGVIRQAAAGLLHAHRAGIIHRDVKPGNLMRAVDGTVKVLDLGLARISTVDIAADGGDGESDSQQRSKGRLIGTLPFMSPEQLEDADSADARSDIYSLGATLYFLLTANPPFTGEYLDQVYGHRHGEIPDLIHVRDDVDLNFAHIFARMMAKSPSERYASLDEVIDELSPYASQTEAPLWLAEFAQRQTGTDTTTVGGGSTSSGTSRVFAIDFGMFYSAAAAASPIDGATSLSAGDGEQPLLRMAIATDADRLLFGSDAVKKRAEQPRAVVHCLPMYIGKTIVERKVGGRQCPPEVLMAMLMSRIYQHSWDAKTRPKATAITVPACYDQLHRRSVLQAAEMAGFASVRLVDRSIASVQSLWCDHDGDSRGNESTRATIDEMRASQDQTILFVGLTGQASEVAVFRHDSTRLHQLATAGHWQCGTLPWLQRLVHLAAVAFVCQHGTDPRRSSYTRASLQMGCERAMNSMLLLPSAAITIDFRGTPKTVQIERANWLKACDDLISGIRKSIILACQQAAIDWRDVDMCVTLGAILRVSAVSDEIFEGLAENVERRVVERKEVALGAAACLAAELPGRGNARPPRNVTSQTIGIVIEDAKRRRRILPIIPKGTLLPARTNRRLVVGTERESMTLSLVESSGIHGDDWQSLGRYEIQVAGASRGSRTRTIGFDISANGLLTVRAQAPGTPASMKLPPLPTPELSAEDTADWTRWLEKQSY